ncbi:MAG: hypothetical protein K5776_09090 [Lachnospiraceae bacterium]|nr:hypothetical protein [Lachnospiraceae bacterium]
MKKMLIYMRNGFTFSYSWLVICSIIVSLISGKEFISTAFLLKILALSAWASVSFTVCFLNPKVNKKGFIFSLTLFYILFIPAEIAMFYLMGIFVSGQGSPVFWTIFIAIVVATYVLSLLIDLIIMRKKAGIYTQKLNEYKSTI